MYVFSMAYFVPIGLFLAQKLIQADLSPHHICNDALYARCDGSEQDPRQDLPIQEEYPGNITFLVL